MHVESTQAGHLMGPLQSPLCFKQAPRMQPRCCGPRLPPPRTSTGCWSGPEQNAETPVIAPFSPSAPTYDWSSQMFQV
jgi:hypothetical protein